MKTIAPDYFSEFKCIGSACGHNCCSDWIISIDRQTAIIYKNQDGPLGERLRYGIEEYEGGSDEECARIRLLNNGRCPFLNQDNLCQLVIEKGEDFLCKVCATHPRFCNAWTDRRELGLGMVCEEAGRIILKRETPLTLVVQEDDGEKEELTPQEKHVMEVRDALLAGVQTHKYRHPAEQRLLEYLIWYHIAGAADDNKLLEWVDFVKKAFQRITSQWHQEGFPDVDALVEICRVFCRTVEHCSGNMLDKL